MIESKRRCLITPENLEKSSLQRSMSIHLKHISWVTNECRYIHVFGGDTMSNTHASYHIQTGLFQCLFPSSWPFIMLLSLVSYTYYVPFAKLMTSETSISSFTELIFCDNMYVVVVVICNTCVTQLMSVHVYSAHCGLHT